MADEPRGPSRPLVPPLVPAAVYQFPDLDALDRMMDGAEPGYIYARDGHPNARGLADDLARLEGAAWGLIGSSGMAVISICLLGSLRAGDRVAASDRLYGRTTQLLRQELPRLGVQTDLVDVTDAGALGRALSAKPKLLFVETMSNPLLRLADLPALAESAHAAGAALVVDNTFATPVLVRPLELGADFVVESLTKLIGGHSDVTLGLLCGRDPEVLPTMTRTMSVWGLSSAPFDCWLAQRGLDTLPLRVSAATANAAALADWLAGRPGVERVVYPGRPDHPDHDLAGRLMPAGCGHMLCFELAGGREAVNRFLRRAVGIPFSPSLGHVTTTCSHPATTSHRYDSPAEKRRQGIGDGLVRLSVGVEPLPRIQAEMANGLGLVGADANP